MEKGYIIPEEEVSHRKFLSYTLTGSVFLGLGYLIYFDDKKEEKRLKDFKERGFRLRVGDVQDLPPFNKSSLNSKISYQGFSDSKEYVKMTLIKRNVSDYTPISFNYPISSKEINIDGTSFSVMKVTEEELIIKYLNTQK